MTEARLVSSPADGEAYRIGEKIRLQMTFTEPMDVVVCGSDDTVFAGLYVGFVDQNWREAWRSAIYEDGAATSTFTFAYTVKATDVDNNGVRIVPGTNTTGFGGGGNIVSVADNTPSSDWYEGSWHLTSHKVNGQPSVGGGAAFDLDDANDGAWDVWVGSEMVLVVDQGENKIFAYDDGGRREPSRDIDLDQSGGMGHPRSVQPPPVFGRKAKPCGWPSRIETIYSPTTWLTALAMRTRRYLSRGPVWEGNIVVSASGPMGPPCG